VFVLGTHVDSLIRETRRNSRRLFFGFGKENGEFFNSGHREITPIVSSKKGLDISVSRLIRRERLTLTLPFKSRKKRAEAMAVISWKRGLDNHQQTLCMLVCIKNWLKSR
jgi:hypothetical protein